MKKTVEHIGSVLSEDKGFYIILFLCILAIGISGYVLFFTPSPVTSEPLDTAVYEPTIPSADLAPVINDYETPTEEVPVSSDEAALAEEETATMEAESVSTITENTETPAAKTAPVFVRPISGKMVMAFSGDELVFHKAMGDWRTHTGADYAAQAGDRVYAMADGTVQDVYLDALYGYCVSLRHTDNLETVYMGLHDTVKVNIDDTVKAGDILGTVGQTNQAEGAPGIHLHVEALKDGERIDPESLFTNAKS